MTKKYSLRLSLLLVFAVLASGLRAQINTPAGATVPFNSNPGYSYGILPTNLPSGGTYGKSQDAADAYNEWKTNYIEYCAGNTQARVKFDDVSKTVSEGIAYGMLLSAYAADQTLFNKLWAYYKANVNGNGIMNWKTNGCSGTDGWNGATDAELDAAMALIIAESQWPTATNPYNYGTEATSLINKIKTYEMHSSSYQAVNGDGWGFGNTCRNPSYQSPAYYQAYAAHVPGDATFWNNAVTAAYSLINNNAHNTTGLVSNWSDNNGNANSCNGPNEYGFDACRNPWRMATDVIWYNSTNGKNICNKIASYVNGQGAGNVRGPRNQNGSGGGYHNATFVSTYATAIVGTSSTYQSLMNQMYTETKNVKDNYSTGYPSGYFGNTLRVISLFMMTGNFWKPGTQANQEINVHVSGTDVPHNSTYDFQNVQNNTSKVITFTIENKGSLTLNLDGTPNKIAKSGTHAAMFTINQASVASTLSGGQTTTFTVTFTPTSSGTKTAQISIASNDADEDPYIINLTGTGTVSATNPEIAVSKTSNINSGGTFGFGDVTTGASHYAIFTINNTGDGILNISGITVSAGQGYTLDQTSATTVSAGGSTTFRVKFTPGTAGLKTGTVTITSDDPDEGTFVINLTGTGVNCSTAITSSNGVLIDYDANKNVTRAFAPTGPHNEAFVNDVADAVNPSYLVSQYVRSTTNDYDVIRYNSCGANYVLTTSKPMISMLVYSPQVGVPITVSAKKTGGAPVFADYSSDKTQYTTKANQWERIYFDFSNVVSVTNQFIMMDIMVDPLRTKLGSTATDRTYLIDDIRYDANPCFTDLPVSEVFNDYDDHRNVQLAFNPLGAFNQVFGNPASSGLNTSATVAKYDRLATGTYDVIRYNACGTNIDLSGKTTVSLLIYSPVAGIDVIFSMKKPDGADADTYPDAVLDVTSKTTVANQWQRLYFDFSSIANNSTVTMFDIMIDPLATQGVARTYYIDDIKYDVNPCNTGIALSGVMQDYDANRYLDLDVSSAAINDLFANPSAVAPNTSATVARVIRPGTGDYHTVRYKPCGTNFDLSPGKTVYSMQIYSPSVGVPVIMALKQADGTTDLVSLQVTTTVANGWETLKFDFSDAANSIEGAYLDIMIDPLRAFGAATYYIDNIKFSTDPEINVVAGGNSIIHTGNYDFGTVVAGSSSAAVSFLIQNNGPVDLNLTGTPIISISGPNASEFTVDQTVTTSVVGAASTTSFTVTFSPTSGGAKAATISIANSDANENPYIIYLDGTGQAPEINVKQASTNYASGSTYTFSPSVAVGSSSSAVTFTIENLGNATLNLTGGTMVAKSGTHAADFTVTQPSGSTIAASGSRTFTVTFSPSGSGTRNAVLTIANNDSDEGTYTINLSGTATAPEINVKQASTNYASGDTYTFTPSVSVGSSSSAITFTIENLGDATLNLTGGTMVAKSGTDAADFTVTQPSGSTIAASGSRTFTVTFSPSGAGVRTATLTITNNDLDEGTYTINLSGTGTVAPEINVKEGTTDYASGDTYTFSSVVAGSSGSPVTFTIENTGNTTLNLTGATRVQLSGTNSSDFSVDQPASASVAASGTLTFTVTFSPATAGTKNAVLTIQNDDSDEGTYTINITGTANTAPEPEINVKENSTNYASGSTYTFTPSVSVGSSSSVITFTIENLGNATLNLTGGTMVAKSGTHAADFTVTQPSGSTIAASASRTFTVTFSPSGAGTRNAVLTIANNDSDEGTYTINLSGTGTVAPEINVKQNTTNIASGETFDMGSGVAGSSGSPVTFTIENTGNTTLNLTGGTLVSIAGANASEFSIGQPSSSTVAASGSVTFTITFNPTSSGSKSAAITIANDDSDEGSYVVNLTATASPAPEPEINIVGGATNIASGGTHDFGTVTVGASSSTVTFTIQNTGTANLNLTSTPFVILSGTDAADFTVVQTGVSSPVTASGSVSFTVTFNPSGAGTRNAMLTIANNDANEGSYVINLTGIGSPTSVINQALSSALNVSPNPAQGQFVVNLNAAFSGEVSLKVRNALGEVIYADRTNTSGSSTDILVNLLDAPAGIYILEIETAQGIAVKRVVKQ